MRTPATTIIIILIGDHSTDLLFLTILCLPSGLPPSHQTAKVAAGAGADSLGTGALSAGLQACLAVDIVPNIVYHRLYNV